MIFTSYHAMTVKLLKEGIQPISISRWQPRWMKKGNQKIYLPLAPTSDMLKKGYDWEIFHTQILAPLDITQVKTELLELGSGKDIALLCYEKLDYTCHRHVVREWFTTAGIDCTEWKPGEIKA